MYTYIKNRKWGGDLLCRGYFTIKLIVIKLTTFRIILKLFFNIKKLNTYSKYFIFTIKFAKQKVPPF